VKLDTFAMVNLIAGERIVPELIQDEFTAERVASEAIDILTNQQRAARIRAGLADVRRKLGEPARVVARRNRYSRWWKSDAYGLIAVMLSSGGA
jgi:lipid A disaccharide synthetase